MIHCSLRRPIIQKLLTDSLQLDFLLRGQALCITHQAQRIAAGHQIQILPVHSQSSQHTSGLTIGTEQNIFVNRAIQKLLFRQLAIDSLGQQSVERVL